MAEGLAMLERTSRLPRGRIRYLPESDESAPRGIGRGLLVLMAFWSGPARAGFARLEEVLGRVEGAEGLELVVADLDGSPGLAAAFEAAGLRVGGNCETAWVRDGRIVELAHAGEAPGTFEAHTRALLALP